MKQNLKTQTDNLAFGKDATFWFRQARYQQAIKEALIEIVDDWLDSKQQKAEVWGRFENKCEELAYLKK